MTYRDSVPSSPVSVQAVPGLRHGYLSLIENLAQTVGVLSPAGTISVIIPLLILSAGNGTWLLLLATLSIFLLVMCCVVRFAALYSSAGSIAAFSRLGWGARGGLIGAWIYLFGISYCVPSALLASASYADVVLAPWVGFVARPVRLEILATLLTLGCALAAYRDIKLSTILMLVIECLSVSLMLVLLVGGMWSADAWADHAQIHLDGVRFSGLQGGLVLAFMLMAGFEGTTSLGEEARDPRKTIPKAIVSCMVPLTVVYLLVSYCLVSLENRGVVSARVEGLSMPFDDIAQAIHLPWLGPWSSLGVALSYFACGLGSLIIASRVLFSMARAGEFWPRFGEAHPRNATPHRAIALISIVSAVVPVVMLARGMDLGVSVNFLSQLGSLGLIGGYFMMVVALPLYLRRRGLLKTRDWMLSAAAGLMLVVVLVLSVYPKPPAPYDHLAHVFGGSVLAGVLMSVWTSLQASRKTRVPEVASLDEAPGTARSRCDS